jgi:hypothetical protein
MPELETSLGLACHYVNPHDGRQHAAIIIKVRTDGTVNLTHFDPESGIQQRRDRVAYSLELIANTFHWQDDQNEPQTAEEKAAVALSTVSSAQTLSGVPPSHAGAPANEEQLAQKSQTDPYYLPKGSVELRMSDAPAAQPIAQPEVPEPTIPPIEDQEPPPETPVEKTEPEQPPEENTEYPNDYPQAAESTPTEPSTDPQIAPVSAEIPEQDEREAEAWERDPEVTEQRPFDVAGKSEGEPRPFDVNSIQGQIDKQVPAESTPEERK